MIAQIEMISIPQEIGWKLIMQLSWLVRNFKAGWGKRGYPRNTPRILTIVKWKVRTNKTDYFEIDEISFGRGHVCTKLQGALVCGAFDSQLHENLDIQCAWKYFWETSCEEFKWRNSDLSELLRFGGKVDVHIQRQMRKRLSSPFPTTGILDGICPKNKYRALVTNDTQRTVVMSKDISLYEKHQ